MSGRMKRPREQQESAQQSTHKYNKHKPRRTLADPKAEAKAKRNEVSRGRNLAKQIQVHSKMARSSGESVAKPSILVDLAEEEFLVTFLNIWDEHVPGFGNTKKRERSERELKMEWRTRLTSRKKELGLIVDEPIKKTKEDGKNKKNKNSTKASGNAQRKSSENKKSVQIGGGGGGGATSKAAAKAATKVRKLEMEKLRLETVARYKKLKQTRNSAALAKKR